MSHRRAWTEIVERSLPMALILEDDVVFSPRLKEYLQAIEPLCDGQDVVRVETQDVATRVGPVTASSGDVTLHSLHTALWGCGGLCRYPAGREDACRTSHAIVMTA